ncbi:YbaY family lipoprotein [Tepidicaulis sp. LMO-SS28]|uniref:YbaY family lipoprotein n=1 Tax=Tepidicaulis sp. LMO-SS28 TaxID=3447455 RepID=UPI003EE1B021
MRHLFLGLAALICAGLLASCGDGGSTKISGDITSATPITVPEGARAEIALLDISEEEPAKATIAETSLDVPPDGTPFAYELPYDPEKLEDGGIYTLAVRILVDGDVRFAATHHNATVTGKGTSILDVVIEPVAPSGPRLQ